MSSSPESLPTPAPAHPPSRLLSILGLVFAAVLLAVLGLAAWAGYQAGLTTRADQARATQVVDLQAQFDLGIADLGAGRYRMATARFEYILALDPHYPAAREKLAEAQAGLNVTPTAVPPTLLPVTSEDPAGLLTLAERYAAEGSWDLVIDQITRLRVLDPDYEVLQGDHLIFTALRGRGLARIQGDQMEAGIFDLDQAGQFGTLDPEARNYRAWARLYLAAKSYYGLDWARTVDILRQLYVLAPNFKDTARLLHTATLALAAQLNAAGDTCLAAENYAAAQQLFADAQVADLLAGAQASCALTPSPAPTDDSATPIP
jgi:tetratricopeptide (TPR) repeat protein